MRELGFIDEMKNEIWKMKLYWSMILFSPGKLLASTMRSLKNQYDGSFTPALSQGQANVPFAKRTMVLKNATFLAQTMEDRGKILDKRKLCYASLSEISKKQCQELFKKNELQGLKWYVHLCASICFVLVQIRQEIWQDASNLCTSRQL